MMKESCFERLQRFDCAAWFIFALILPILFSLPTLASPRTKITAASRAKIAAINSHAFFEKNVGQATPWVKYLLRGADYQVLIAPDKAEVSLPTKAKSDSPDCARHTESCAVAREIRHSSSSLVKFEMVGTLKSAKLDGAERLPIRVNYYVGRNPHNWLLHVPAFDNVTEHGVYDGIDLVYRANGSDLEYQFLISPRSNPAAIRIRVKGTRGLRLSSSGDLIIDLISSKGEVTLRKPMASQRIGQCQKSVYVKYRLLGNSEFGFEVRPFDRSKNLTIDPVLFYSTYLGFADAQFNGINAVAVAPDGSMFATGAINGTYIHQGGVVWGLLPNGAVSYVVEIVDTTHSQATEIVPLAIAADSSDNAYITGYTYYNDLPFSPGTLQPNFPGNIPTGFVARIDTLGNVTDTYLGGSGVPSSSTSPLKTFGNGVTVDAQGAVYVVGSTGDSTFPTAGNNVGPGLSGPPGAFVVKMKPTLQGPLQYSTFLVGDTSASGVAVDSSGLAYVTGSAASGGAFVAKLSPDGNTLLYSKTLHGSGNDSGTGVAVDSAGNAYVVGTTNSTNFPVTPGAFQTTFGGVGTTFNRSGDAFVAKLDPSGTVLAATYLGGSGDDLGLGIAVNGAGNAYVAGTTTSPNFPQQTPLPNTNCSYSSFVTEFDPTLSKPVYSICLGGGETYGSGIALASGGTAVVAGWTLDQHFPTTPDAAQPVYNPAPYSFVQEGFLGEISACTYQVQFWSQADSRWGSNTYDLYPVSDTTHNITMLGCALTSLAMALNYAGFNQVPGQNGNVPLDPGSLNSFMNLNHGYSSSHGVYWAAATHAVSLAKNGPNAKNARFVPVVADTRRNNSLMQVLAAIKDAVCNHGPVVVGVKVYRDSDGVIRPHHFVVVTAVTGDGSALSDFVINDPADGRQPAANSPDTLAKYGPTYNNQFIARGYIQDPPGDASELIIGVTDAEPMLIAPNGQTGYSLQYQTDFLGIPNSYSFEDGLDADDGSGYVDPDTLQTIGVYQPASGTYQLTVSAPQLTTFDLSIDTFLQDSTRPGAIDLQGITSPGSPATFQIQLNTVPGSGSPIVTQVLTFNGSVQDIANLQQLGLITDTGLAKCLNSLLQTAQTAYQSQDYGTMSRLLNSLVAALQTPPAGISPLGAQVLRQEAESLLSLAPTAPIYPIANCVTNNGNGTYTASFGYENDNSVPVTIPLGTSNFLSPTGQAQNPATYFTPGQVFSPFQNQGAFSVTFNGSNLFWTVQGPDGVYRTATASANSPVCQNPGS